MVETVFLAKPRGFCAGVVMAIEAVERAADAMREAGDGELTVYHAIVHNRTVVDRLTHERGVHFVERIDDVERVAENARSRGSALSDTIVFSAHGVSPAVRRDASAAGLATIDATCPLVTKVHTEVKKFAARGDHVLLVADDASHQEVVGTVGEAPDAVTLVAVLGHDGGPGLADPRTVEVPDPERVAVVTQTTLNVDHTLATIDLLRVRFPKLTVPSRDDLCYATKNRQDAVRAIAGEVDLFLVVSSATSSNGNRLVELAEELTGNARRIDSVDDVDDAWLDGVRHVGITSAASTPDDLVQAVVARFRRTNPQLAVVEEGEWEAIEFRAPRRVPADDG